MGQEINASRFTQADFDSFGMLLRRETDLLESWFRDGVFASTQKVGGFELEACLVAADMGPAPIVEPFLDRLADPLVVPELATFNAEINGTPQRLQGNALSRLAAELESTWKRCGKAAAGLDARLAMIGILPTLRPEHLDMAFMSPLKRYRALNEQILHLRHGRPLTLEIQGKDHLFLEPQDVMMESAATSFQIHLKVTPEEAARVYNWSKVLAAPMVAVSANSPFLFGCDLWAESRIPLFEQAVSVGGSFFGERVTFGLRYVKDSVFECFRANLERFPSLLPQVMDEPPERLAHLRLHNGTIWRWNRPLIGFDESGKPHLRIEHRVVPAGPTVSDAIANAALYFGAIESFAEENESPEKRLPFVVAKSNFYSAARDGLDIEVEWIDGQVSTLRQVLADDLLPRAHRGLTQLGIDAAERDRWLGIIEGRLRTGQTGSAWQRAWVEHNGRDLAALTAAYLERQQSGHPVHQWSL
ncbi:MAG: glutamate--cysteine ligase [Chromatiaceae bacterium]|jgi:hypothetical protein|nr:glutamate--cysteine ligase [Chromatiaceae bacterium]